MYLQIIFFFLSIYLPQISEAHIFTMEMHHRFSDHVKQLSPRTNSQSLIHSWPQKGSIEYYVLLATHDRAFRGRALSNDLTFSDGNSSFRISSLGFLHYTTVTLGTPAMKFLVALDTGSDLFWVPCLCTTCASIYDSPNTSDFELSMYDPDESVTSKNVTCDSDLCTYHASCTAESSRCHYHVAYVSSETSTSGFLVEDILHLRTLDNDQRFMKAYVTFGCGQVQTGSFLDNAAPNGIFGLGLDKTSVPSILSKDGYVANSFSMCFGLDGTGRINFGDKGSLDQEETPFLMNSFHPTYTVNVTQFRVGTTVLNCDFTALFDSGTSFTYLVDPFYTALLECFHSHVRDKRRSLDARIPFEYCYTMSPETNTSLIPSMSLTMGGGGFMVVYDPIIVITTHELVYCLAVIKSPELNIIGQNFMTGYRIVFDREKLVLGWKKFDCYETEDTKTLEPKPVNFATVGVTNHTTESDEPKPARNFGVSSLYRYTSFQPSHLLSGYTYKFEVVGQIYPGPRAMFRSSFHHIHVGGGGFHHPPTYTVKTIPTPYMYREKLTESNTLVPL